ncbi:MAG: hypothetical protein NTW08_02685 [Gammaproteobacteria bacterium]|nr:hypothetical protein [Gammaproteobacteria bacterium]
MMKKLDADLQATIDDSLRDNLGGALTGQDRVMDNRTTQKLNLFASLGKEPGLSCNPIINNQ